MTDSESRSHDDASTESTKKSAAEKNGHCECHETVDPETREDVLAKYKHRCQSCGRCGPDKGGLATLHVHHIERDPDGMDEHDMENLSLLCRACHSWLHQQSTPDDSPVEITDEDRSVLLPQDIEILRFLAANGPLRTGEIASGLPLELSVSAVRERLWVLMGLDNRVESRDQQVVDKNVETGEWGLTEQIENSARGHIPDDQQLLLQRMEDEQVRQALERGCDRSAVTDVLGISRRTTFNKIKRAYAYNFPLDAFSRGGRPSGETAPDQNAPPDETPVDESDEQQRLDTIAEGEDESLGRTETWGTPESESKMQGNSNGKRTDQVVSGGSGSNELREHLQQAIDALQEVDEAL